MSYSQTRLLHGQTRYNIRSRLFYELPEGAMKWLTPKNQSFGGSAFGFGTGYATSRGGASGGFGKDTFASPPVPVQKAPSHGLHAGMKVFHTKFGEGTVVSMEGQGDDARAQVNFPRHGIKWRALSVAKLTPVT
jgi:DNA helicase-2/ATP-dependent DNA helicase PcrA